MKNRLDHWIFDEFRLTSGGLGLFRIAYCLYIVLFFGLPESTWVATQPQYLFNPHLINIATLAGEFPPYIFFLCVDLLIVLGFAMLLAGWHTKKVSILLPLLVFLVKSFQYSFGKIDHDVFAWLVPLVMSLSGWGESWSVDNLNHRHKYKVPPEAQGWPLSMLAMLLAFGFFSAALPKLLGGWLNPATHAVQAHLNYNYFVVGRQELLASSTLALQSGFIWESMDWMGIFVELAIIVAIVKKSWLRYPLFAICVFHLINLLLFNISFSANYAVYLAFLPWNRISAWFSQRNFPAEWPWGAIIVSLILCGTAAAFSWSRQPDDRLMIINLFILVLMLIVFAFNLFFRDSGPESKVDKA